MNKKRTTLFIFALVLMLIPSFAFARPIDVEIEDDHGNIVYRKENGNVVLNKMPRLDNTPYVSPGSKIEVEVTKGEAELTEAELRTAHRDFDGSFSSTLDNLWSKTVRLKGFFGGPQDNAIVVRLTNLNGLCHVELNGEGESASSGIIYVNTTLRFKKLIKGGTYTVTIVPYNGYSVSGNVHISSYYE